MGEGPGRAEEIPRPPRVGTCENPISPSEAAICSARGMVSAAPEAALEAPRPPPEAPEAQEAPLRLPPRSCPDGPRRAQTAQDGPDGPRRPQTGPSGPDSPGGGRPAGGRVYRALPSERTLPGLALPAGLDPARVRTSFRADPPPPHRGRGATPDFASPWAAWGPDEGLGLFLPGI